MADPEQLKRIREGVAAWNRWREEVPRVDLRKLNLRDVDLSGADLSEADLNRANLIGANLIGADLGEANLIGTSLMGANLRGANLCGANLSSADLHRANLQDTDLRAVNLSYARLNGANLDRIKLHATIFGSACLGDAKGLDTCRHFGPSIIDYQTLAQSGMLPLAFLRGCGLPDALIDYLPSLLNQAIQFYSCFISYSTKDQEFAQRLYADLQTNGVRCWFAPHQMQGGKKIHEQIDEAIRLCDRLLLILSEHSIASEWVQTEIANARKREAREKRKVLFPVRLIAFDALRDWECFDADMGKDSAREIREFYIPDFSNWKNHDSYQEEFGKLLRDLKAEEQRTSSAI